MKISNNKENIQAQTFNTTVLYCRMGFLAQGWAYLGLLKVKKKKRKRKEQL